MDEAIGFFLVVAVGVWLIPGVPAFVQVPVCILALFMVSMMVLSEG